MNLVFMGTPEFAVPALEALVSAGHRILRVYCQPPRPAGRGGNLRSSPVQVRAEALGLRVSHPASLNDARESAEFAALGADAAVAVAYGMILPPSILEAPVHGCLNIHASLLPRWRGAAPIHRAIMAGDSESGVCVMRMEQGLDCGPVLLRRMVSIGEEETTGELHDRLASLGSEAIVEVLACLSELRATPQLEDGIAYAAKIDKAEARIDWTRPAVEIARLIRGLSPFPGAWCVIGGERVKCLGARAVVGSGEPGTILDSRLTVACGEGAVRLTRLQRAGRGPMDVAEFLQGRPVAPGVRFGES